MKRRKKEGKNWFEFLPDDLLKIIFEFVGSPKSRNRFQLARVCKRFLTHANPIVLVRDLHNPNTFVNFVRLAKLNFRFHIIFSFAWKVPQKYRHLRKHILIATDDTGTLGIDLNTNDNEIHSRIGKQEYYCPFQDMMKQCLFLALLFDLVHLDLS